MLNKLISPFLLWLILLTLLLLFLYSTIRPFHSPSTRSKNVSVSPTWNFFRGHWVEDPNHKPTYDETSPFHRNAWNCLRNKRECMGAINSWKWVPRNCDFPRVDPFRFLDLTRNKNIRFVEDLLNQNLLVSFLCILRLKLVLEHLVSYIQSQIPGKTLKFWRLQSPRHFHG